jgi:KUP system potassium uptake protein
VFTTWHRGREIVTRRREEAEGPLSEFIRAVRAGTPRVERVPGTAVFLNRNKTTAPLAMRATADHLHALSEQVVILSIQIEPIPHMPRRGRVKIDDLGYKDDGILHATVRFGYMDTPDVPEALRQVAGAKIETKIDADEASYFVSKIEIVRGDDPTMSRWRKHLFLAITDIAADAAEYFVLPRHRTVIMGARIEL